MYTVDLLGGEAVPIRSRPGWIAFVCLLTAVPLLVGIAIVGIHLDQRVTVSIRSQQLARLESILSTLSPAVDRTRLLESQKVRAAGLLADISTALGRHTQWSPALTTVAESLPDVLVLTNLYARQEFVPMKRPSDADPDETITVSVPVRSLGVSVWGRDGSISREAVRQFQDRLRSSAALGPRLDAVTVSQESGQLDGQDGVCYELNCIFKPELK